AALVRGGDQRGAREVSLLLGALVVARRLVTPGRRIHAEQRRPPRDAVEAFGRAVESRDREPLGPFLPRPCLISGRHEHNMLRGRTARTKAIEHRSLKALDTQVPQAFEVPEAVEFSLEELDVIKSVPKGSGIVFEFDDQPAVPPP